MKELTLQELIDHLQQTASTFLNAMNNTESIYSDDISSMNSDIHYQINELYDRQKEVVTINQETALCLALLMGYSVSMYANPEDEEKRNFVLEHSHRVVNCLSPSFLKNQLLEQLQKMES